MSRYKINASTDKRRFENMADELIKQGYRPYGELKIIQPDGNFRGFFQVFLKLGEEASK